VRPRMQGNASSGRRAPGARAARPHSVSVLVVSCEDPVCTPLVDHLRAAGHRVTHRRRTVHVRQLIRQVDADALVITLPSRRDRGGWKVLAQLQSAPPPAIPIVALADPGGEQTIRADGPGGGYSLLILSRDSSPQQVTSVIAEETVPSQRTGDAAGRRSLSSAEIAPRFARARASGARRTSSMLENVGLVLHCRELPDDLLASIHVLSEERRKLLRDVDITPVERRLRIDALEAELEERWVQRRRQLSPTGF
jgi:CheY-like chemotaxis protein